MSGRSNQNARVFVINVQLDDWCPKASEMLSTEIAADGLPVTVIRRDHRDTESM